MTKLFSLALLVALTAGAFAAPRGGGPKDIKIFVQEVFKNKIEAIKSGLYCRAISCEFEVENFIITETTPRTYALSTSGWLEGTIPGLKGSARRAVGLTGTYARGTCIVKDLKTVFDVSTNNKGWGASKIEAAFQYIDIPKIVVLDAEDCTRVETYLFPA